MTNQEVAALYQWEGSRQLKGHADDIGVGIISDGSMATIALRALSKAMGAEVRAEARTDIRDRRVLSNCDILLLDVCTSALEPCIQFCDEVAREDWAPPILAVGEGERASPRLGRLLEAGAASYADVGSSAALAQTVTETATGHSVVSRTLTRDFRRVAINDFDARILRLLGGGRTDHAIAQILGRGDSTIKNRVGDLMHELGLRGRFQLGVWASVHGLASDEAEGPAEYPEGQTAR